jgi:hypothetical protein
VIAQPPRHHRKIRRRATQLRPLRQQIPQQFTDSQDQMLFFQGLAPVSDRALPAFSQDGTLVNRSLILSPVSPPGDGNPEPAPDAFPWRMGWQVTCKLILPLGPENYRKSLMDSLPKPPSFPIQ